MLFYIRKSKHDMVNGGVSTEIRHPYRGFDLVPLSSDPTILFYIKNVSSMRFQSR